MVPQPRSSARSRQTRASHKSKVKFVPQEVGRLQDAALEEEVWSRWLPDDVFCTILACLPLSSFFRLRCVCKKWSVISQDPIFINAFSRVSSRNVYLFVAGWDRRRTHWMYESALNSWKYIPSSFFCPKGLEGTWWPVGAVGSKLLLVNFADDDDYGRALILLVYNPLNGMQEKLLPMSTIGEDFGGFFNEYAKICVTGMPVDPQENWYKILVTGRVMDWSDGSFDDEELVPITLQAQIYDSRTSAWDEKKAADPCSDLHVLSVAAFGGGLLYLTEETEGRSDDIDYPLLGDLMVSRMSVTPVGSYEWGFDGRLHVPRRDRALAILKAHIFVSGGRLMLAGAVPLETTGNVRVTLKSIIIWELPEVGAKWVRMTEIDTTELPRSLVFLRTSGTFFFLSEGDSLYFGSDAGSVGVINVKTNTLCLLPEFRRFEQFNGVPATIPSRLLAFGYQPGFDLVA